MKRKCSLILTLTITITLLFNSVIYADQDVYTNGPLRFIINESGSITIIEYFGKSDEVKVPISVGPYTVEYIDEGAFKGKNIKKIELPDTIVEVPSNAFDNIGSIDINYYNKEDENVEPSKDPIVYIESETNPDVDPVEEEIKEEVHTEEKQDNNKEETSSSIVVGESVFEEGFTEQVIENVFEEDVNSEIEQDETQSNVAIDTNQKEDKTETTISNVAINSNGYIAFGVIAFAIVVIIFIVKTRKK